MARVNYSYRKRQKELAKQKKNEEKKQRKLDRKNIQPEESETQVSNAKRGQGSNEDATLV